MHTQRGNPCLVGCLLENPLISLVGEAPPPSPIGRLSLIPYSSGSGIFNVDLSDATPVFLDVPEHEIQPVVFIFRLEGVNFGDLSYIVTVSFC